ncbi:DedA family protein [Agrococcus carbonis]|uniref:Membrane protein DedA, SNARE-associated domain n=1 Tax=Agrococcus carbonis TaxID=684552 RepID=A0A1H1L3I7_9MICO|nr:membrane protein DedA, SNARE-associated domain [Agrococcus carbonis]
MIDDAIGGFLDAVAGIDPLLRTVLAGIAILLETSVLLGLVVPGDTIVIVAALAVEEWPWWLGLIVATVIGALCGETIGFAIGRWLAPAIDRWLERRWPRASKQWRRTERYLARRGGPAIFLSRFLPVAHSLVPLIAGGAGMPYRRFLRWTLPACLLWATAYATAGWLAGGTYRELADRLHGAGYVLVAVIAGFILLVWVAKRVISRSESRHMDDEQEDAAG